MFSDQNLLLLAVSGGVAFSVIGWAYRSASARSIPTCFVAVGMGLMGVGWFGWRSFHQPDAPGLSAPALVWVWGIVNGVAQGYCVYLFRVGLRYGPFAPLWCAGNLVFVTPAIFSLCFLGERLNRLQALAMITAALCVVTASMGRKVGDESPLATRAISRVIYPAMLSAMIILTGLCGAGLKHLSSVVLNGSPLNPRFNDCFMLAMYGALLAWVLAEAFWHGTHRVSYRWAILFAVVAGSGSVTGMTLTGMVSRLAGGIGFAVIAVASVLSGSLITSFGFGERRTWTWWATVVLAMLAVLLFQIASTE
ncbi:MAG: hypothetical protein N3G20_09040 [Verrucomicrobiae bacterium]|nr:hypothetical protein [Verrucomicrobiae bacterium]